MHCLAILLEALEKDEVFDVVQHLHVDAAQSVGTRQPELLVLVRSPVEVILPDPGPLKKIKDKVRLFAADDDLAHLRRRWKALA